MTRRVKSRGLYVCALLCLIVSGLVALKGITFAATAGDAAFEPPQVCDAACQAEWQRYGHKGDKWLLSGGFLVTGALALSIAGYRVQKTR